MQLNPILPSKSLSKSRTTPTFTGIIDVEFLAIPISKKKIIKKRREKKQRTGFEGYFLLIILLSTCG
ncbi:hypothetical protein NC651_037982 [Populus alba x Populus x berolinensis]|nr:hypothetical protein NC651_037982 [Populus alba x Populus x berolinensis]